LFIACSFQCHRVRRVSPDGVITTVVGSGAVGAPADGTAATAAPLNYPVTVARDCAGTMFVGDQYNNQIYAVSPTTGSLTIVAGSGVLGYAGDGGPATAAQFSGIFDIALDDAGNLYVADQANGRLRVVWGVGAAAASDVCRSPSASPSNTASSSPSAAPASISASPSRTPAAPIPRTVETVLDVAFPSALVAGAGATVFVGSYDAFCVYAYNGNTSASYPVLGTCGTSGAGPSWSGAATAAAIGRPNALGYHAASGVLYSYDTNCVVLAVAPNGTVSHFAGRTGACVSNPTTMTAWAAPRPRRPSQRATPSRSTPPGRPCTLAPTAASSPSFSRRARSLSTRAPVRTCR
jgi:hypothetical protein